MDIKKISLKSDFKNICYILKKIFQCEKSYIYISFITAVLLIVKSFAEVLFPKYIIEEITTTRHLAALVFLAITMFLTNAVIGFFDTYLKNINMTNTTKVVNKFLYAFTEINLLTEFINTEDPVFLGKCEKARMAVYRISNTLLSKIFLFMSNFIICIGYAAILLGINPLIMIYIIFSGTASFYLKRNPKKNEYIQMSVLSEHDRYLASVHNTMSDFSYGKEIRIYSLQNMLINIYKKILKDKINILKNIKNTYLRAEIFELILLYIQQGVIYIYLIYAFINGEITISSLLMYSLVSTNIVSLLQVMMSDMAEIHSQSHYIMDIRNFLETASDINDNDNKVSLPDSPFDIEFRNVSFKYPNSSEYALRNFSIHIMQNERLAVVGRNGAGKSTLIKLICRLYEPTEGAIYVNGTDIRQFNKKDYMSHFATVFQDIHILAFSVSENIAVKEPDGIDKKRVTECIEKVGLQNKISSLKNSLDTSLLKLLDDDGVQLSGGENQRISLARALYKDCNNIILDEPSSALDPIAEAELYQNFNSILDNKTAIYISHRLSSTQFCDRIIMLENGMMIECGTHFELLRKNGKYAEMFNIQAQYYMDEYDHPLTISMSQDLGGGQV